MSTRADVLTALRSLGVASTCPKIAARAGYSTPATREALRALVRQGVLRVDGLPRVWAMAEWDVTLPVQTRWNEEKGKLRASLHDAIDALVLDALTTTPRLPKCIASELWLPPRFVALSLSRLRETKRARLSRASREGGRAYSRGAV